MTFIKFTLAVWFITLITLASYSAWRLRSQPTPPVKPPSYADAEMFLAYEHCQPIDKQIPDGKWLPDGSFQLPVRDIYLTAPICAWEDTGAFVRVTFP